jgi:uncharacterized protein (DUF1501 family)
MIMKSKISRRDFVRLTTATSALSAFGGFERAFGATSDLSGYKALVCVFLFGGNSSFNWVVPSSSAGYNTYKTSRGNLALNQGSLLPLNGTASDGNTYGFHANCPDLQSLFNTTGKLAVLCNTGTLVQPSPADKARVGAVPLPFQLFSHIDQQTLWQTAIASSMEKYGWAGRVADLFAKQASAKLSFNLNVGGANGANYWQEGRTTIPYVLGTNGAPVMAVTNNTYYRSGSRRQTALDLLSQAAADDNIMVREYASIQQNAAAKVDVVNGALAAAGDVATAFPSYAGDSALGAQLHQVARMIKARSQIGDARQFFFVSLGGFDHHNAELADQANLFNILSKNLKSFWTALGELGMQNNVTTFTASDFGRSLNSNGDGSDHAWGGHSVVMGGAVQGGKYYGTMPNLTVNGPDDLGNGRIIPTTSTDQYAATLARWFGVADADLDTIFPNLKNFASRNLGFLG